MKKSTFTREIIGLHFKTSSTYEGIKEKYFYSQLKQDS